MSAEDPRKVLLSIHDALNRKDLDGAVAYLADDVVGKSAEGTWKGKAENKRYFEWMFKSAAENKVTNVKLTSIGIHADGNLVTREYLMEGTAKGGR
jgi:ketosteroid isomerase-like protein